MTAKGSLGNERPQRSLLPGWHARGFAADSSCVPKEREYLDRKGLAVILEHGRDFIEQRLAPAAPLNDGKQTPMGNHPVFVAQHATGTCCRGCLEKWHAIPKGRPLSVEEKTYVLGAVSRWLRTQIGD